MKRCRVDIRDISPDGKITWRTWAERNSMTEGRREKAGLMRIGMKHADISLVALDDFDLGAFLDANGGRCVKT